MELVSRLKSEGFAIDSWHALALHLYNVGELEKCETVLQECVEEHELLDERLGQVRAGQSEVLEIPFKEALKTVGVLTMLELNLALDCFETNFRKSESALRRSEDRLKQFMKVYSHRCASCREFKTIHKYWGFLYLYKSAITHEVDLSQRNAFLDQAEKEFTIALEHNTKDTQAISGLANVLYQKMAYYRALRLFSTILLALGSEKCPNTVRLAMACCYLRIGNLKKSQECCKRAIFICIFGAKPTEQAKDDYDGEKMMRVLFTKDDQGDTRLNREFLESEGRAESLSQFERQTLSDLLLCFSRSTNYKGLSLRDAFEMVARIFPRHPALVLYAGNAEFCSGLAPNSHIERELQSISKRCSNFYCALEAHFQIAKRFHIRRDIVNSNVHYSAVVGLLKSSYRTDPSLLSLYLYCIIGAIKTSCGLQKWDIATQYIHMAFDSLGIKGSMESLRDYNHPVKYLYELLVPTISLVIMSVEDPTLVPTTISIFSQLTVDERLLNCLHYLLFMLDKLGDIDSSQCYVVVFLLQKTTTCLLFKGRRTIRRSDYNYKVLNSLISKYTNYSVSLNPLPLMVLLFSCLKYLTVHCIASDTLTDNHQNGTGDANSILNATPYFKYGSFVKEHLGIYLNNLGVCIMECATSLSPEHCSFGSNEYTMLNDAMKIFGQSRDWYEGRSSLDSMSRAVEIVIRFNSAVCCEFKGLYANANDEYKRLTSEFPWFTSAWLRRACLALERNDFQLAAQYCELSLNSKSPDTQAPGSKSSDPIFGRYLWVPGIGNNQESANLLLSHIYSCQRKLEKSFGALSKVIKSKNPHYSNVGKVLLGMALYNKAKSQVQSGYSADTSMYNPTSIQSRLVLSEVLRHETHNYVASNIILIQVAENGLFEPSKDVWKYMTDISSAMEGAASCMHYVALINLGVLHAVLLAISTQRSPPPAQHNLTLKSIVDDNIVRGVDGRNEILGSHPHFAEQKRIMKTVVKLFMQALQFDPTEKIVHMSLIKCCFDMNMWEDARRLLEKATIRWPNDLTFRMGLAYCLERLVYSEMGDMERAKHPGRVKYWMMLCEAVGGFYHWLSIIKETFQTVDMDFIRQVKNNKLSALSLQKFAPGVVRYGQDNKIVLSMENKDEFRYRLPAIPLEGTDLLPNVEYLTKQELIMSRKLYSRFEELLPIVEQVYEKEQRDVEELRIRSEGFRRKQEEERLRKEEEERAASERIKLLSIELGKEAESIAASLPDAQVERKTRASKRDRGDDLERLDGDDGCYDEDDYESVVGSESDSYSDSKSDVQSNLDLNDGTEEGSKRPHEHKGKSSGDKKRKKKKIREDRDKAKRGGGDSGSHVSFFSSDGESGLERRDPSTGSPVSGPESPDRKPRKSKKLRDSKKSKREEKRRLRLKRLEEQTAALLEENNGDEPRPESIVDGDDASDSEKKSFGQDEGSSRLRLKKRRFENTDSEVTDPYLDHSNRVEVENDGFETPPSEDMKADA